MSVLNLMDDDQLDAVIQGLERIKSLEAEVARLRLTDAEREAIGWFADYEETPLTPSEGVHAAALRGLRERTK